MSGRIEVAGLIIDLDPVEHPLLGSAQRILRGDQVLTHVSAIDWEHPSEIPAIAAPGSLPTGAGGAIMNLVAERARGPLRYAGPYPTPALYRSLLRSFYASADEATFTRDAMERMSTLARDPIPVDFTPAPHRRVEHAKGVSEVRAGLERTTIDGIVYERDGSPGKLVDDAAEVWFGDSVYARVARFDTEGNLVDGPHPIPPLESKVIGTRFPPELAAALGELLTEYLAPPFGKVAPQLLAQIPIVWADLGARAVRQNGERIEINAAIWERIAPLGLARVVHAIAEALAPIMPTVAVAMLQRMPATRPLP